MKGIKNSLKKLSTRLSFRDSIQSTTFDVHHEEEEVVVDVESKRHNYREKIAKITTVRNFEFPEDAINSRIVEALEDLDVRDDDIFLFSYPASNGHLLEDMVRMMVNKDQKNQSEILHSQEKVESIPVGRLEASNQYGHLRWLKSLKSPRLLASHLPFDLIPKQLHAPNAKIIYLARNPKDHIVAYYYHHRLKGIQVSLDDFIDLYLAGYLLYGSYFDHVVSYWQLSKIYPNNILFISYEELKIVPFQMATIICDFLNLNLTEDELSEILLQKHGMVKASDLGNQLKEDSEANRKNSVKISKFQGVLGDWVNYFNADQVKRLNEMISNRLFSQQLFLTDDASTALKRINKFGRLLEDQSTKKVKEESKLSTMTAGDTSTWAKAKSKFRKKPVFTEAEAVFIRKKDKVVIVEERYQPEILPIERKSCLSQVLGAVFCCFRHRGYTPF